MKRSLMLLLIAFVVVASGIIAEAQQPKKVPQIGLLFVVSASAAKGRIDAFRQGLRDLGYVRGEKHRH